MPIKTNCPSCGAQYNLADEMTGKNVQCKGCKDAFVVEPWMYPNMAYAPLISGGRTVREYQIGEFQAKLMTEIELLFPEQGIRYTHILYTYRAVDDPIFIVAAETNVFEPEQTHCGLFTPSGRQNLGVMESWANLETFAAEANSLTRKHLGIAPDDKDSSVEVNERDILSSPSRDADGSLGDFGQVFAEDHWKRGEAFSEQEEYEKAIAEFSEAIRIKPGYADAYYSRGYTYRANYFENGILASGADGDLEKAIHDFSELIRMSGSLGIEVDRGDGRRILVPTSNLLCLRAETYMEKGDVEDLGKAIADFSELIRLDPKHSYFCGRCQAYQMLGQNDKVIDDLTEMIQNGVADDGALPQGTSFGGYFSVSDPAGRANEIAVVYHNRGVTYKELGQKVSAKADFAKAKKLGYDGHKAWHHWEEEDFGSAWS